MAIDWSKRSSQAEIMDDFEIKGALLRDTLRTIATINHWLGSNAAMLGGIKQLLKSVDKTKTISIVDLGCGSGEVLRAIAKFGHKNGLKFQLLGIDANGDTLDYAAE
ncbi:MAG: methyltransferase, partial [Chitinophagaceae bacterium]